MLNFSIEYRARIRRKFPYGDKKAIANRQGQMKIRFERSLLWAGLMGMGAWFGVISVRADEAGIGHSLTPAVEYILIRGMERGIEGDYPGAIFDFSEVIRAYPDLADGYFNRGIAYQRQGNFTQAIADFNQTLTLNPQFAEAYLARGQAYVLLQDRDRALNDFQTAAILFQQQGNGVGYQQATEAIAQLN
jgi:tetratricopeptide (TPR) repeat protein